MFRNRGSIGYLSKEIRRVRNRTGVPYTTLYLIACQIRQLSQNGLSAAQVRKAIKNMHPVTMSNLTLTSDWNFRLKDSRLVWERRWGWKKRGKTE